MRLRPGTHVLWRDAGSSQVHTGEDAVVLDGLTDEEQLFLDSLEREASEQSVLARARELDIRPSRARGLLAALDGCGALQRQPDPVAEHSGLGAEADHWSRVARRDAGDLVRRRREA